MLIIFRINSSFLEISRSDKIIVLSLRLSILLKIGLYLLIVIKVSVKFISYNIIMTKIKVYIIVVYYDVMSLLRRLLLEILKLILWCLLSILLVFNIICIKYVWYTSITILFTILLWLVLLFLVKLLLLLLLLIWCHCVVVWIFFSILG